MSEIEENVDSQELGRELEMRGLLADTITTARDTGEDGNFSPVLAPVLYPIEDKKLLGGSSYSCCICEGYPS